MSCESLQGLTGDQVNTTLQAVASLTGEVTTWNANRGDVSITDASLKELSNYSAKSGGLGGALASAMEAVAPETQAELMPIVEALSNLGGYNEADLMQLDPEQRDEAANEFSSEAAKLDALVKAQLNK
jgi:hypothetical protein